MQLHILPRWFPYLAIALCGVILVKKGRQLSRAIINHERIHFAQQREMLWLPFFVWYGVEFLVRLAQLRNWDKAYTAISFEQEAYGKEYDMSYRAWRKPYSWVQYLKVKTAV